MKQLFLAVFLGFMLASFGQTLFKGNEQKYTFIADTSYWKKASPEKVARKVKYDKESKGKDTKYEYIFCTNHNEDIDRPYICLMILPTSKNAYEETKVNFGKRAQVKLTKLDSVFTDHDRKIGSVIADDKKQVIGYTVTNFKNDEPYYSCNITYFRDKYILMFVMSTKKEDLEKTYGKFKQVVLSTKF